MTWLNEGCIVASAFIIKNNSSARLRGCLVLIPSFIPKPSTHRMYAQDQLFHTYGQKVFTDNQMSRIKYNYYISNVSEDYDDFK
jgi:hypothetical protein